MSVRRAANTILPQMGTPAVRFDNFALQGSARKQIKLLFKVYWIDYFYQLWRAAA